MALTRRRVPFTPAADVSSFTMDRFGDGHRQRGEGCSGANLVAMVCEAGVHALQQALGTLEEIDVSGPNLAPLAAGDGVDGSVGNGAAGGSITGQWWHSIPWQQYTFPK